MSKHLEAGLDAVKAETPWMPGPWIAVDNSVYQRPFYSSALLSASPEIHICDVRTRSYSHMPDYAVEVDRDNAHLIAAAPDLYEALQLVCDTYGFDSSIDSSIWQTAYGALARARGETP